MKPEALRELRQRAGLSQNGMAAALGVPLRTYQDWEYGMRRPAASARSLIEKFKERMERAHANGNS